MKKISLLLVLLVFSGTTYSANYNMSNTSQTVTCGSTDNFYDSGGSGAAYGNSLSFTMTISPGTAGQFVSVNFTSFNLEAGYDFLYIYDGTSTSARLIGGFNGNVAVGTITSTTGSLTFRFTSDAGTTAAGWAATVSCSGTAGTPAIAVNTSTQIITCGTTYNFYDPGGFVGTYGYSQSFTLTVTAGTAGQCVSVNIPTFSTENNFDYLYVYDGTTTGAPSLGTFTGGTAPGTLTSTSGSLTFRFTSDGFVNAAGWSGTISCIACPAAPILMSNTSQTITCGSSYNFYDSGNSGADYGNSLTYQMTISPSTAGQYVSVNFASFNLEAGYDFLYIYDGTSTSARLIGGFNGNVAVGTITSTTGSLTFRFTSDPGTTAAGWAATLSCSATAGTPAIAVNTSTQTITCGTTYNFYDPGGNVGTYGYSQTFTLTVTAGTAGQCVSVNIPTFSTENNFDYLYVYDGTTTGAPLLGTFTGGTAPGTLTSSGGSLTFRFTSDAISNAAGWSGTISCIACPAAPILMSNTSQTITCGSSYNFYDSGNSGADYGNSLTYQMTISPSTAGQYVSVNFASFNLEVDFDYLYIYDGTSTSSPMIGSYSGAIALGTITSSTGSLTFRFTSDAFTTAAGWAATLSCTGTPGSPTISENTSTQTVSCGTTYNFYDSGGSQCNYTNGLSYTLTVNASTAGQCIRAIFTSFSTENNFDYLYVYDGNSTASPLIGTYTGATSPGTITGTSGSLTFRFTSDGNTTSTGWVATLSCSAGCSGTPAAGTANASPSSLGCGVLNTTLSLTGATSACGITYQWQSSPDNVTWTNIAGATSATYVATPSGNTYYRCIVTCAGNNANSASAYVTTAGGPANDFCANAQTITLNAGAMIGTYTGTATGTNTCATADGTTPSCFWGLDQNLWYKFTAPYAGGYYVDVRGGTMTYPELVLYNGTCGAFTEAGCAGYWTTTTPTQPDSYESLSYSYTGICNVAAGTVVYINVDDDGTAGTFTVNVGHQTNDNIALATVLNSCGTTFNSSTIGGTNCGNCVGNGWFNDLDCNAATQISSSGNDTPTNMSVENDTYYQFCVAPTGPTTTFTVTFTPVTATCLGPNAGTNPLQMNLYTGSSTALTWINGTTGTAVAFSPTVSLAANQCAIIEVDGSAGTNCDYQLSINGAGCPLPVELISFTAENNNNAEALLKWSLASEKDIKNYVIEKSVDGFNYAHVKTVNSLGNSTLRRNYETKDEKLLKGTSYYRLSSIDIKGNKDILAAAIVSNRSGLPHFSVYPNPSTGIVHVNVSNFNTEAVFMEIFDVYGNKIWESNVSIPDGEGSHEIDLSGLSGGVYFLKTSDASVAYKRSFIITKNN